MLKEGERTGGGKRGENIKQGEGRKEIQSNQRM